MWPQSQWNTHSCDPTDMHSVPVTGLHNWMIFIYIHRIITIVMLSPAWNITKHFFIVWLQAFMISRKWHSKVISQSKRWIFFILDKHNCEVQTDDCKVYGHLQCRQCARPGCFHSSCSIAPGTLQSVCKHPWWKNNVLVETFLREWIEGLLSPMICIVAFI